MDEPQDVLVTPGQTRRRRLRIGTGIGLAAAGLVGGMTLAGLGLAHAQTATPSATPTAGAPSTEGRGFGHRGFGGRGGCGFGGGALHGEFTTPAPGGGYQTMAVQNGDVTSVSASSITIKSEDGFSRSYGVDNNTLVNAGNNGIADVKSGDTVHITAVVSGGSAHAVEIMDVTNIKQLRGRWEPARPSAPSEQPSGAPSA